MNRGRGVDGIAGELALNVKVLADRADPSECLGERLDRADPQDNEPSSGYATFEVVDEFVP